MYSKMDIVSCSRLVTEPGSSPGTRRRTDTSIASRAITGRRHEYWSSLATALRDARDGIALIRDDVHFADLVVPLG